MQRRFGFSSRWLTGWLGPVLFVSLTNQAFGDPLPPDPANQFLRAFVNREDPQRGEKLLSILKSTQSVGELHQILLLPEWQRPAVESEKVIATNDEVRRALLERMKVKYKEIFSGGDPNQQRAVAKLIGDAAGFGIVGETSNTDRMLPRARQFRKLFAEYQDFLMGPAKKAGISQRSCLLALAKIESEPKAFGKLIEDLLDKNNPDNNLTVRRHASEALKVRSQVVNVLMVSAASSQDERLLEVKREFLQVGAALIPVAAKTLSDPDQKTRDQAIEALQAFADIFMDIDFLIPVREAESLTRELPDLVQERIALIQDDIKLVEPLIASLQKAAPDIGRQAINKDTDIQGRLECLDIIEDCVTIRRKLWSVEYGISAALKRKPPENLRVDPLPPIDSTNEIAMEVLSLFMDPDPRIRKAAAQAYEFVGGQPDWRFRGTRQISKETADLTAKVAATDPDPFVRWVAVRSLGHIAAHPEVCIPALVERLKMDDLDLRIAALVSLKNFGTEGALAVDALNELIDGGDADFRIQAMQTAESIGTAAKPMLQNMSNNLLHPNPKVRIQCAQTLGRFGNLAVDTLPALRRNLRDPDPEVRLAASAAVLRIEGK